MRFIKILPLDGESRPGEERQQRDRQIFHRQLLYHTECRNGFVDLVEGANLVKAPAEFRCAGPSVEIAEEVNVHLHGRKGIWRRDVVIRVFPR